MWRITGDLMRVFSVNIEENRKFRNWNVSCHFETSALRRLWKLTDDSGQWSDVESLCGVRRH